MNGCTRFGDRGGMYHVEEDISQRNRYFDDMGCPAGYYTKTVGPKIDYRRDQGYDIYIRSVKPSDPNMEPYEIKLATDGDLM